jgi:hypothetical protein
MHNQNFDVLIYIFDIFEVCIMYQELANKFANFNILKDLVRRCFEWLICLDLRCLLMR